MPAPLGVFLNPENGLRGQKPSKQLFQVKGLNPDGGAKARTPADAVAFENWVKAIGEFARPVL
ncbi:MAG: hypothetical protein L0387_26430 [Acidobacteria bacterium]|nr:hypothetical protein [Acidobacteriota bacterium]MCI0625138.1 hypothetical protein [Acidobacteriota bacterium]MCI0724226.1 hypothetical protein [Acidobacteriota bacterium]